MDATTIINGQCPDCGHHCQYIGATIHTPAQHVMCCAASIARHNAALAANPVGVRYVKPAQPVPVPTMAAERVARWGMS